MAELCLTKSPRGALRWSLLKALKQLRSAFLGSVFFSGFVLPGGTRSLSARKRRPREVTGVPRGATGGDGGQGAHPIRVLAGVTGGDGSQGAHPIRVLAGGGSGGAKVRALPGWQQVRGLPPCARDAKGKPTIKVPVQGSVPKEEKGRVGQEGCL
eukprot:591989-Prorocentrum_minimum.AAC.2